MKKLIVAKLDKWADNKTQKEFNDWITTRIFLPIFILMALAIMTIDSWPL